MAAQASTKTVNSVKPQKNRQGSAIVSMILGIISTFFLLLAIITAVATSNQMYSSGIDGVFAVISGIVSLLGFPLGLWARKSSKGRGMAIAGITLTILPFLFVVFGLIATVFIYSRFSM
ncbi:hypothetical protein ACIQZI_22845 [Peribacillus sp. NPDC096379]|uniref:hypothetical protein n=1 Tax=Peribacillus sp. NPDC096379 TaxID=3364393 RepID=UPI0038030C9B